VYRRVGLVWLKVNGHSAVAASDRNEAEADDCDVGAMPSEKRTQHV
jgi:hypothetical protein